MIDYPSLNRFVNSRAWWLLYLLNAPGLYGYFAGLAFPAFTPDTAWFWGYALIVIALDAVYIGLLLIHFVWSMFEG